MLHRIYCLKQCTLLTIEPVWLRHLQVTPLATGVSSFAAASFDRWIYVIGGGPNGKLATDQVQCWEPGADSWELRAPIPIETKCTNAVTFKNCIYVVGKLAKMDGNQVYMLKYSTYRQFEFYKCQHFSIAFYVSIFIWCLMLWCSIYNKIYKFIKYKKLLWMKLLSQQYIQYFILVPP